MRSWHLAYEIDIDAETIEDAVRQATASARNPDYIATWCVLSSESNLGESVLEITGMASLLPTGEVQAELNELTLEEE